MNQSLKQILFNYSQILRACAPIFSSQIFVYLDCKTDTRYALITKIVKQQVRHFQGVTLSFIQEISFFAHSKVNLECLSNM